MRTPVVFVGCLLIGSVVAIAGTFTNTGSASTTCIWGGNSAPVPPDQGQVTATATGANINLTCPSAFHPDLGSYIGPSVVGNVGNLSTKGSVSFGPFTTSGTFSFQTLRRNLTESRQA